MLYFYTVLLLLLVAIWFDYTRTAKEVNSGGGDFNILVQWFVSRLRPYWWVSKLIPLAVVFILLAVLQLFPPDDRRWFDFGIGGLVWAYLIIVFDRFRGWA
mgnify:CR=1 FL=1